MSSPGGERAHLEKSALPNQKPDLGLERKVAKKYS